MPRPRQKFSREYKLEAVKMITEGGLTAAQAARNLGINPKLIFNWKQQLESDPANAFPGEGSGGRSAKAAATELQRLRQENEQLRMERDFLKKAAAFFAKESG